MKKVNKTKSKRPDETRVYKIKAFKLKIKKKHKTFFE